MIGATPRQAPLIYEFGEFRLDALRRVLSSRGDGQPLQVTGKIFDTLLYFVERSGQLLDKRTLMEALWPDVVVEESNLTQTIHTLRRVLGERPDDHRFIVTVPGRGYRFVATVTTTTREEPQQPAKRRLLAAAAAAVALLIGVAFWMLQGSGQPPDIESTSSPALSIAVLPFVDMSETQDQAYFAEGLSEEILNLLAQSTTLRVTARTSSFSFKGRSVDVATIADTLKITHVLEGSVRKSGERVRITAQLVDGATSVHLWSQTYDRDLTDVFGVQDEIAAAVAESLQVTLTGSRKLPSGQTKNALAFERYLQGKYFFNRRGESDVARAQEYFEQALQLDPSYARAWAGLAGVYQLGRQQGRQEMLPAWRAAVDQALALGPNLADAHVRAAQYYWWLGDHAASETHCHRAIALNPSDPLVLGASAGRAFASGHGSEGIALQRRAVAVDPLSAVGRANLGAFLTAVGEWDEAIIELEKARELSPTLNGIDSEIVRVQILRQRFDEALAMAERIPAGPERDECIALAHRAPGQQSAADAALARLVALANGPDHDPGIDVAIAEAYASRGDEEEALQWLTRALQPEKGRNWTREDVLLSPFLRALHADSRWQTLVARVDTP
jgi:TolB-like protein/DNA-binding winged helix-turn-helix (wHTH) protein/tetratricopeptide (TPR) repeat protein